MREMESFSSPAMDQVNRLNRLAGQIGGISRMIEEGRAPHDILTQFKAVRSALSAVEERVIELALRDGVEKALQSPDRLEMARRLEELFRLRATEPRRHVEL